MTVTPALELVDSDGDVASKSAQLKDQIFSISRPYRVAIADLLSDDDHQSKDDDDDDDADRSPWEIRLDSSHINQPSSHRSGMAEEIFS